MSKRSNFPSTPSGVEESLTINQSTMRDVSTSLDMTEAKFSPVAEAD